MHQVPSEEEFSFKKVFFPLTTPKAIHMIIIIGLLLYFICFFNGFISDDFAQIVNNTNIHSLANIPALFSQGTTAVDSGQTNNFYRPLLSTTYALIYAFSGGNPFGYHIIQVILHIGNTLLLFFILRHFLKIELSLAFSLIFLIHPINTQSVVYVATMGENLFLFFGLLALYITSTSLEKSNFIIIPLLLLLSILSKETGILFLFLIPVFTYLYNKQQLKKVFLQIVSVFIIYSFLRFGVAHIYINEGTKIVPMQTLSFLERMVNVPMIIFYYLKTLVYPIDLAIFQSWVIQSANFYNFFLPLFIDMIFFIAIIIMGVIIHKKNNNLFKHYLFFAIWFLLGLVIILQVIPLDETVSDNWFYFPIIGLLGMLGVLISSIDLKKKKRLLVSFLLLFFVILILFSLRTIVRITNWYSQETLFIHDIRVNKDSHQLEGGLSDVYYLKGDIAKAEILMIRSTELFPSQFTYTNLGTLYLRTKNPNKAITAYNTAIKYDDTIADSWGYLAIAKYHAGDKKGALTAAEKAYILSPTQTFKTIIYFIQNDYPININ